MLLTLRISPGWGAGHEGGGGSSGGKILGSTKVPPPPPHRYICHDAVQIGHAAVPSCFNMTFTWNTDRMNGVVCIITTAASFFPGYGRAIHVEMNVFLGGFPY